MATLQFLTACYIHVHRIITDKMSTTSMSLFMQ